MVLPDLHGRAQGADQDHVANTHFPLGFPVHQPAKSVSHSLGNIPIFNLSLFADIPGMWTFALGLAKRGKIIKKMIRGLRSVCHSAYNRSAVIKRVIDSVRAQALTEMESIVSLVHRK